MDDERDERLDVYVQQRFSINRTQAKQAILAGQVLVNGSTSKPAYRVLLSDDVVFEVGMDEGVSLEENADYEGDLSMLFEDDHVLVLEKPLGMLVHQGDVKGEMSLVDVLLQRGVTLFEAGQGGRPGVVHRLDRMTEGLLVMAKSQQAYDGLVQQFRDRKIEKVYWAMLGGNVANDVFEVDQPIGRHGRVRHKYCVQQDGKPSITRFEVVKRFNSQTLCKAYPKTGRTHQIRVHAAFMGHPIIGDEVYAQSKRGTGQLLQACSLGFTHPVSGLYLRFFCSISNRFGSL